MKPKKFTTECGFRLLRTFSDAHNAHRFQKHSQRQRRAPEFVRWHKRQKTRLDRRAQEGRRQPLRLCSAPRRRAPLPAEAETGREAVLP